MSKSDRKPDDTNIQNFDQVSVIIPAKNEAGTITSVIESIPLGVKEILVVAGDSTDGTEIEALNSRRRVEVLRRTRPGKGSALSLGLTAASGEFLIALDADGAADGSDIPALVAQLELGADMVKGERKRTSSMREPVRLLGNLALTRHFNRAFGTGFADVCCGYVGLRRDAVDLLGISSLAERSRRGLGDGFEIECLMLGRAIRRHLKVARRPVRYLPRRGDVTKTRPIIDAQRILRAIHAERSEHGHRAAASDEWWRGQA